VIFELEKAAGKETPHTSRFLVTKEQRESVYKGCECYLMNEYLGSQPFLSIERKREKETS
jgi:hypothetical protein